VEPAINGSQDSPYPTTEEVNPEEPSFVQLTRLEPTDNDQHSGIGVGDYSDDPHQVYNIKNTFFGKTQPQLGVNFTISLRAVFLPIFSRKKV
jgi:hypothetical protein